MTDEQRLILNNLKQILVAIGAESDGLPDKYVNMIAALHFATLALLVEPQWSA